MKEIKEYITIKTNKLTKRRLYMIANLTLALSFLLYLATVFYGYAFAIFLGITMFLSGQFFQIWVTCETDLKQFGIDMIEV